MRKYNRIMLGKGGVYASECLEEGYIGCSIEIEQQGALNLHDEVKDFNNEYVPLLQDANPGKSKVSAGLTCGFTWTICKGLQVGDIVLSPNGSGEYMVGEITGEYYYQEGTALPHRRAVQWKDYVIPRASMSNNLRHSAGSIGTCCDLTRYAAEIEELMGMPTQPAKTPQKADASKKKEHYYERELHKLFCTHLRTQDIYAKTIYQEKSNRSDQAQQWVHPDIVGVHFDDLRSPEAKMLLKATDPMKGVALYSYELKREINTDYELKQYYFQALSNSSWANYGYLVAFEIAEDLAEEMERLNQAFGIGIILMQPHSADTQVLYPAREKQLDYRTIEKLCLINSDFRAYIGGLLKVMMTGNEFVSAVKAEFEGTCDKIFESDEAIEQYCNEHQIPMI